MRTWEAIELVSSSVLGKISRHPLESGETRKIELQNRNEFSVVVVALESALEIAPCPQLGWSEVIRLPIYRGGDGAYWLGTPGAERQLRSRLVDIDAQRDRYLANGDLSEEVDNALELSWRSTSNGYIRQFLPKHLW